MVFPDVMLYFAVQNVLWLVGRNTSFASPVGRRATFKTV